MKKDIWVLVANSSLAKIFKIEKNRTLILIEEFTHPESRLHERDLVSSAPGRSFESVGSARHAMEPAHSQKMQEFNNFARDISHYLDTAHNEGKFGRLYISAGPLFLGILRQIVSNPISQLIAGEVDKDLTQMDPVEIRANLPPVA